MIGTRILVVAKGGSIMDDCIDDWTDDERSRTGLLELESLAIVSNNNYPAPGSRMVSQLLHERCVGPTLSAQVRTWCPTPPLLHRLPTTDLPRETSLPVYVYFFLFRIATRYPTLFAC